MVQSLDDGPVQPIWGQTGRPRWRSELFWGLGVCWIKFKWELIFFYVPDFTTLTYKYKISVYIYLWYLHLFDGSKFSLHNPMTKTLHNQILPPIYDLFIHCLFQLSVDCRRIKGIVVWVSIIYYRLLDPLSITGFNLY